MIENYSEFIILLLFISLHTSMKISSKKIIVTYVTYNTLMEKLCFKQPIIGSTECILIDEVQSVYLGIRKKISLGINAEKIHQIRCHSQPWGKNLKITPPSKPPRCPCFHILFTNKLHLKTKFISPPKIESTLILCDTDYSVGVCKYRTWYLLEKKSTDVNVGGCP